MEAQVVDEVMTERGPVSLSGTRTRMTPGSVMRRVPAGAAICTTPDPEAWTTPETQTTTTSQTPTASPNVSSPVAETFQMVLRSR